MMSLLPRPDYYIHPHSPGAGCFGRYMRLFVEKKVDGGSEETKS